MTIVPTIPTIPTIEPIPAGLAPDVEAAVKELRNTSVGVGPVTAEQRGADWQARYGCPSWCVMDHTDSEVGEPGWHQGPKIDAIAPVPGCNAAPDDEPDFLLAARVTQTNQDPEAFGIETRIWFDYGIDTAELNVEQTDRLIAGLERFLPQLRALRGQLAAVSADDTPGDPVAKERIMAELDAHIKAIVAAGDAK